MLHILLFGEQCKFDSNSLSWNQKQIPLITHICHHMSLNLQLLLLHPHLPPPSLSAGFPNSIICDSLLFYLFYLSTVLFPTHYPLTCTPTISTTQPLLGSVLPVRWQSTIIVHICVLFYLLTSPKLKNTWDTTPQTLHFTKEF